MRARLRSRSTVDEQGFTLIELMVVVLIIAILLAIAIPTFLGARGKAQSRAAQSDLRNALTAEKTVFADNANYSRDTSPGGPLVSAEPSIKWTPLGLGFDGDKSGSAVGQVGVIAGNIYTDGVDAVELAAMDASGTKCWYIFDESASGGPQAQKEGIASGTYYAFNDNPGGLHAPCQFLMPSIGQGTPSGPATKPMQWGSSW